MLRDRLQLQNSADGLLKADSRPRAAGMLRGRIHAVVLIALLLGYLAISLHNLAIVPRVYEDEPWQASTGWKLARQGVFGSDMMAGFHDMERRYYGFMPLHPLLLAAVFRVAGVGLFQARLETVLLGLLTLALTYALARRLFQNPRISLLAIMLLVAVRLTDLGPNNVSGIFFLDMSRISRYDIVVPVFGLAALHVYLTARERSRASWYIGAGALAGLAGLGHVYGVFWLPILMLLAFWDARDRARRAPAAGRLSAVVPGLQEIVYLCAGFVLPWLPYLAYVYGDLADWRAQTQIYVGEQRFGLLDPRWYLDNLLREYLRYNPGFRTRSIPALVLRVGLWSTALGLPLALGALAWRALRRHDRAARVVAVPAIVFPVLFALLLHVKMTNYLLAFVPLWAIALAWSAVALWAWLGRTHWSSWARPALALLLLAVLVEGASGMVALETAGRTTTPYDSYIQQVRRYIPPGARVVGLHNYWFGLEDFDYRSFAVPVYWTNQNNPPAPIPFDAGMDMLQPDIVLLDARIRGYLNAPAQPGDEIPPQFERWLGRHDLQLLGQVDDATYGLMEIYRVRR